MLARKKQHNLTPNEVLERLQQGNYRYVHGKALKYNNRKLGAMGAKKGQAPLAFIFSCVDSRSVPEMVFNQPPGSLFVSRIAGNVISPDVLGSMEFATKYAGTRLVVIMGHTQCGAVAGACAKVSDPKNLNKLLKKIRPAVGEVAAMHKGKLNCDDPKEINEIAKENVIIQMQQLLKKSKALRKNGAG